MAGSSAAGGIRSARARSDRKRREDRRSGAFFSKPQRRRKFFRYRVFGSPSPLSRHTVGPESVVELFDALDVYDILAVALEGVPEGMVMRLGSVRTNLFHCQSFSHGDSPSPRPRPLRPGNRCGHLTGLPGSGVRLRSPFCPPLGWSARGIFRDIDCGFRTLRIHATPFSPRGPPRLHIQLSVFKLSIH